MIEDEQNKKDNRAYWSQDGQVFFCYGYAWGLDDKLNTLCLGTEADVQAILKGDKRISEDMDAQHRAVLVRLLEERDHGRAKPPRRLPSRQGTKRSLRGQYRYNSSLAKARAAKLSGRQKALV